MQQHSSLVLQDLKDAWSTANACCTVSRHNVLFASMRQDALSPNTQHFIAVTEQGFRLALAACDAIEDFMVQHLHGLSSLDHAWPYLQCYIVLLDHVFERAGRHEPYVLCTLRGAYFMRNEVGNLIDKIDRSTVPPVVQAELQGLLGGQGMLYAMDQPYKLSYIRAVARAFHSQIFPKYEDSSFNLQPDRSLSGALNDCVAAAMVADIVLRSGVRAEPFTLARQIASHHDQRPWPSEQVMSLLRTLFNIGGIDRRHLGVFPLLQADIPTLHLSEYTYFLYANHPGDVSQTEGARMCLRYIYAHKHAQLERLRQEQAIAGPTHYQHCELSREPIAGTEGDEIAFSTGSLGLGAFESQAAASVSHTRQTPNICVDVFSRV